MASNSEVMEDHIESCGAELGDYQLAEQNEFPLCDYKEILQMNLDLCRNGWLVIMLKDSSNMRMTPYVSSKTIQGPLYDN